MACQGASYSHCEREAKKIVDSFNEYITNLPPVRKFQPRGLQMIVSDAIKNKFICHNWEIYTWVLYSCLILNGYEVNWILGTPKHLNFDFTKVQEDILKILWEYECETW